MTDKLLRGSVIRQFRGSRSAFKTHVVCVTDKDVVSLANRTCSYSAVIKKKRTKDDNKYYIEKEGRNLEHSEHCVRNSANCPGNTTMKSRFMQHVQSAAPNTQSRTIQPERKLRRLLQQKRK
jgi:hypothetical protein